MGYKPYMASQKSHNWKSTYHSIFDQRLQEIKNEGHYRYFNEIERKNGEIDRHILTSIDR